MTSLHPSDNGRSVGIVANEITIRISAQGQKRS